MKYNIITILILLTTLFSCIQLPETRTQGGTPIIFPDYIQVTIPTNIAPLNFKLKQNRPAYAHLSFGSFEWIVKSSSGKFNLSQGKWRKLLRMAADDSIRITIYEQRTEGWHSYDPFAIHVAAEPIDPYLVYRRIAPGFRMWGEMGIYQRDLTTFTEETILNNQSTDNSCMNCHSFNQQSADAMLFHQRSAHAGTYLVEKGDVRTIQPREDNGKTPLTYPYWHPSGKFVAFSSNETKQDFHLSSSNRVEVFDHASGIHIYDMEKNELFSDSLFNSPDNMETFPAFSPDGKYLYFCSSPVMSMPISFREMKYHLLRVGFDPQTRKVTSPIDTLYHAAKEGRSAKFPRISPDGKYLMYTLSDYGNFSIWHKDADLQLMNLETNCVDSMPEVNSTDVDSYHSWSSNSRWFVFSSRRLDGLYTRPFIAYLSPDGKTGKPFLLPQQDPDYYTQSLFSFNIPELVKEKVNISSGKLTRFTRKQ